MIKIIIPERPIALKRHRHAAHCTYNPQKEEQEAIGLYIQNAANLDTPFSGPVYIDFRFYFKLPSTKRLRHKKGLYYTHKPDTDNLCKFYLDCMNDVIYNDDSQVFKISAIKCYTPTQERTEIKIQEIPQADIIFPKEKNEKKEEKYIPAKKVYK